MSNAIYRSINDKWDRRFIRYLDDKDVLQEWAIKNRKKLRREATPAELKVAEDLERRGITFHTQEPIYLHKIHKLIFVDFILPKGMILLEIDGGYHSTLKQRTEDYARDSCLKELGYVVVRFNNDEIGEERYDGILQCFRKNPENTRRAIRRILKREKKAQAAMDADYTFNPK